MKPDELDKALKHHKERRRQRRAQRKDYFCAKCNMWHSPADHFYKDHKHQDIKYLNKQEKK